MKESGNYCYPDVTVVRGSLEFAEADEQHMTIINPRMIIEVTPPSTENIDRGIKFNDYRQIDPLEEYFLVAQDKAQVETFYRQPDGIWALGPTTVDVNGSVRFRSLGVEVQLAEIYARVTLPLDPAKTE